MIGRLSKLSEILTNRHRHFCIKLQTAVPLRYFSSAKVIPRQVAGVGVGWCREAAGDWTAPESFIKRKWYLISADRLTSGHWWVCPSQSCSDQLIISLSALLCSVHISVWPRFLKNLLDHNDANSVLVLWKDGVKQDFNLIEPFSFVFVFVFFVSVWEFPSPVQVRLRSPCVFNELWWKKKSPSSCWNMQVVLHSYTRCCLSWFCLCSTAGCGLKLKLCTRNNSDKNNQAIIKVCLPPPPPTISLLSEVLIVCLFSTALPVPAWRKWGWWRPQQWWWWQWGVAGIWHHSSSCILVQKCVIGDVIFHMTWCYFGLFGQLVSLPVSQSCVFAAVKLNVVLPFSLFTQKSKNQQFPMFLMLEAQVRWLHIEAQ